MICQFKRLIYPKAVTAGDASYMIALYRPCEKVMDAAGNVVSEIKAVGYCLPTADNLRYDWLFYTSGAGDGKDSGGLGG